MDAIALIFTSFGLVLAYAVYCGIALRFRSRKEHEKKMKEA